MSDRDRIKQLEKRVIELEKQVAAATTTENESMKPPAFSFYLDGNHITVERFSDNRKQVFRRDDKESLVKFVSEP